MRNVSDKRRSRKVRRARAKSKPPEKRQQRGETSKKKLSDRILDSLLKEGLLLSDGESLLWLPRGGTLLDVESDEFEAELRKYYKKASDQRVRKYARIVRKYGREAATVARHERILAAVEGGTRFLLHFNGGNVVSVTAGNVEQVPNGTCAVIFDDVPEFVPLDPEAVLRIKPEVAFRKMKQALLAPLPPPAKSGLELIELWAIVLAFWVGIFVRGKAKARPILGFVGPKACGKTETARLLGKCLYGDSFDVSVAAGGGRSVKDFAATIAHRDFVVRDDMQDADRGMMELLCQAATGARFDLSAFHKTLELESHEARAAIIITAIRPKWALRDDVMSRLLIARLSRPCRSRMTDEQRAARVKKARPAIWAATLHMLAAGLANANRSAPISRFVDWEVFVRAALRPMGLEDAFVNALQKMDGERVALATRTNPLLGLLRALAERHPNKWWLAADLVRALGREAGVKADRSINGSDPPHISSPESLGKLLERIEEKGSTVVDVERSQTKAHGNKWRWCLRPI